MRRLRLAILGPSPCDRCVAACCKQNGHDFAVLLRGDEVRRFSPWSIGKIFEENGQARAEMVLPYRDGRCMFLGEDDRCTIYEDRPQSCREFECAPMLNQHGIGRHGEFLERNPRVRDLLQSL